MIKRVISGCLGLICALLLLVCFDWSLPYLLRTGILDYPKNRYDNYVNTKSQHKYEIFQNISALKQENYYKDTLPKDKRLIESYETRKNTILHTVKLAEGNRLLFSVAEHLDSHGRRRTHANQDVRNKHLIIFGGSFVYGHGLEDDETLPWLIHQMQPFYEVYNVAKKGYGPNGILTDIYQNNFLGGINQKSGVGMYIFIEPHFFRAIGDMWTVGSWGGDQPVLKKIEKNKFKVLGKYKDVHPWTTKLYEFLAVTNFSKILNINLPIITNDHYEHFTSLVAAIKEEYLRATDRKNKFYFVFYPRKLKNIDRHKLRRAIEKEGIFFIDYSVVNLQELSTEPVFIPYDKHPNKRANQFMADLLWSDLLQGAFHSDSGRQ